MEECLRHIEKKRRGSEKKGKNGANSVLHVVLRPDRPVQVNTPDQGGNADTHTHTQAKHT